MVVVTAILTGACDHQRIHRGIAPRVDIFPLQDFLLCQLHLAAVSRIVEDQRAFLHPTVDGGIHFGAHLSPWCTDLWIGIQINLVDDHALTSDGGQHSRHAFG